MDNELAKIGAAFKPKGRLFLSADLVGSTAHKQTASFPLAMQGGNWPEHELSPPWLSPISDFYSQFGQVFKKEWESYCSYAASKKLPSGEEPRLWKANGDELIYVKELKDRRELYGCLNAWINALKNYRTTVRKDGLLDIKGTCWFAGFPVTNSEVVFARDPGKVDGQFEDDARLRQIYLREKLYKAKRNEKEFILDFIGPTIDIGFRLGNLATARKLVISVDVAYLAATSHLPPDTEDYTLPWFSMSYDGRVPLKGVLNGRPYPVFWIDVGKDDPMIVAEDRLGGGPKHLTKEMVSEFCVKFYAENRSHFMVPFLVEETDAQFGQVPDSYREFVVRLHAKWKAELKRYGSENDVAQPDDSGDQKLTDAEISQLTKTAAGAKQL